MKIKSSIQLFAGLLLSGLCLVAPRTNAFPFVDTLNNNGQGNLSGQTNVEGMVWFPTGTNTGGVPDMVVTNLTLTYPGLECPGTNSIIYGGGTGTTDRIAINPPNNGTNPFVYGNGTIYYSFVFVLQNTLTMSGGGGFVCGFNNLVGAQSGQPSTVGARIYFKLATDNTGYLVGIGKSPSTPTQASFSATEFQPGVTNFVVVSYTFVDSGTSNDFCQMWINPDPTNFDTAVPPTPDLTNNFGNDIQTAGANTIESFLFRQGNAQVPLLQVSQLRLGHCWGCVTPPDAALTLANPTASIVINGTNSVAVSWGTNAPCAVLQVKTNGLPGNSNDWSTVIPFTTIAAATNGFTETNGTGTNAINSTTPRFYRVKSFRN